MRTWGGELMYGDGNDGALRAIAAEASWPAISPDGQRILFWKPKAQGYSLWLYDRKQAQAKLLLAATKTDPEGRTTYPPYRYIIAPQWSPDGSKVAFIAWLEERPEAYLLEFVE